MNPVFVIGGSRTGSELLKTILLGGPDIDLANEMFLVCPRYLHKDLETTIAEEVGDLKAPGAADALAELCFSGKPDGFFWTEIQRRMDRDALAQAFERNSKDMKGVFTSILECHLEHSGRRIPGAKFPVHYSKAEMLLEWFPNAKLIHTVRDPRAVFASQMHKYTDSQYGVLRNGWIRFQHFVHILIQVKWSTRIHNRLKHLPNYYASKYEDLVTKPNEAIPRLCEFLNIEFHPEMMLPPQYNSSFKGEAKSGGFDKTALSGWRKRLSPPTISLINTLNRGELKVLGYGADES